MKKLHKIAALLLSVCMLLGMTAIAEETTEAPVVAEIAADAVIANVNGEDVVWAEAQAAYDTLVAQYSTYYDMNDQASVEIFRAMAMQNVIIEKLLMQKAVEFGLSELSAEETAELEAAAQADWTAAIDSYLAYFHSELTAESAEADVTAATAEAEAYYKDGGYDLETLVAEYKR